MIVACSNMQSAAQIISRRGYFNRGGKLRTSIKTQLTGIIVPPCCPALLSPHDHSVPLPWSASAKLPPSRMETILTNPLIFTGIYLFVFVESPISPRLLSPHDQRVPSDFKASEFQPPAAIAITLLKPSTCAVECLSLLV